MSVGTALTMPSKAASAVAKKSRMSNDGICERVACLRWSKSTNELEARDIGPEQSRAGSPRWLKADSIDIGLSHFYCDHNSKRAA